MKKSSYSILAAIGLEAEKDSIHISVLFTFCLLYQLIYSNFVAVLILFPSHFCSVKCTYCQSFTSLKEKFYFCRQLLMYCFYHLLGPKICWYYWQCSTTASLNGPKRCETKIHFSFYCCRSHNRYFCYRLLHVSKKQNIRLKHHFICVLTFSFYLFEYKFTN